MAHMADIRKNLKDDLKYVEAFAKNGYVGTVGGVHLYTKKDAKPGDIIIATKEAVTMFNKKGTEVETERDADHRKNDIYSRKYYIVALTDERKAVKIHKGTASVTADTSIGDGKVYYVKVGNGYVQATWTDDEKATINPKTKGWFTIA